ncbi:MAG: hypothetical protein ACRC9R_01190 [Enterovibrio sp.]
MDEKRSMLTSNTLNVWQLRYIANEPGASSSRRVFLNIKGVGVVVNEMQTCTSVNAGGNSFESTITARFFTPMLKLTRLDVMLALIAHDNKEGSSSNGSRLKETLYKYFAQFSLGMDQLENGLPQRYTQADVKNLATIVVNAYKDFVTSVSGLFDWKIISKRQLLQLLKEAETLKERSLEILAQKSGRATCNEMRDNINMALSRVDYDVLFPAGLSVQEILSVTDD